MGSGRSKSKKHRHNIVCHYHSEGAPPIIAEPVIDPCISSYGSYGVNPCGGAVGHRSYGSYGAYGVNPYAGLAGRSSYGSYGSYGGYQGGGYPRRRCRSYEYADRRDYYRDDYDYPVHPRRRASRKVCYYED